LRKQPLAIVMCTELIKICIARTRIFFASLHAVDSRRRAKRRSKSRPLRRSRRSLRRPEPRCQARKRERNPIWPCYGRPLPRRMIQGYDPGSCAKRKRIS
jgi:hypothetical protein